MSADLEALSREIAATSDAVRLAIAAVKANPPHPESPMPWRRKDGGIGEVLAADDSLVCEMAVDEDAAHIAAAVNAAPVLVAEVERLSAAVATAERLREEDRMKLIRCKSAMREWQVASEFADDRAVKANKEVARLQAVVEAARVAVAEMRQDHKNDCARIILGQYGRECDCGLTEILASRCALGLEVSP